MTQRIEILFWKYDPQDWTFFLIWPKERIELLWYDTKDWIFLIWPTEPNTFNITQRIEAFFQHDSKNWTLKRLFDSNNKTFLWLERIEHFFLKMIQRIEPFLKITQRIEPFSQNDSKNLFFGFDSYFWLWLLECYCFVYVDSNNWTVFWIRLKDWTFLID